MPKIVRFHQIGGPEILRFEEVESRQPGRDEVRLRVRASGLNRAESMYYHGIYLEQTQLPSRLGYEVAGVVEAVGEGVDPKWVGKNVATVPGFSQYRYGTLGEEAVVPVDVLGEYPKNLTVVQAAAIWMQYLTAYGALVHVGGVKAGDFVSIPAASSSVGLAAIQIVRDHGATAIAVTRTAAKRAELLALGAHAVIVSEAEDYASRVHEITGGKGARLTFDPVGGPFIEKLAAGRDCLPVRVALRATYAVPIRIGHRQGLEHSRLHADGDHFDSGRSRHGEEVCFRPAGRWAVCAEDCQNLRVCADGRGLPVPGVEPAGRQSSDYGSIGCAGIPMKFVVSQVSNSRPWAPCWP